MAGPRSEPLALVDRPFGLADFFGHSRMAEAGATVDDLGLAHKMDGLMRPAIYDPIAISGSVHSWHDQGNYASGDGGWAHAATEWDRQELIYTRGASVTTGALTAGVTTSIPVSDRTSFASSQWIVIQDGTATEEVQIADTYVGAAGAGSITLRAPVANAHASGVTVYYSPRNEGYLPKTQVTIGSCGGNDWAFNGPFAHGVFGTDPGASRGPIPFQEALRFTLRQIRCAMIFRNTHPSCRYSGFVNTVGQVGNPVLPPAWFFGAGNTGAGYHAATVNGSTIEVATPPSFPGGTVNFFLLAYTSGGGATWDVAVTGATTRTVTSAADTRSKNAVNANAAASTGKYTGVVLPVTGLAPGVNRIVLTANNIVTGAIFLGWGMESEKPPLIYLLTDARPARMDAFASTAFPYAPRTPVNTQTATVGAGSTAVTLGTAVTIGTTGTTSAAVYPGDTITIGVGTATQETRRITAVNSTTSVTVDAPFVNAHTAQACSIGFQEADLIGGGVVNPADTQGPASVPGVAGAVRTILAEFPANEVRELNAERVLNFDAVNNRPALTVDPGLFHTDGLHYNNKSHGLIAAAYKRDQDRRPWPMEAVAAAHVQQRRTWYLIANDVGVTPVAGGGARSIWGTGWTNVAPVNANYPKSGFYKDMRLRQTFIRIACYGGAEDAPLFQLPAGYGPGVDGAAFIAGQGPGGPATLVIFSSGIAYIWQGWGGPGNAAAPYLFEGSFITSHEW